MAEKKRGRIITDEMRRKESRIPYLKLNGKAISRPVKSNKIASLSGEEDFSANDAAFITLLYGIPCGESIALFEREMQVVMSMYPELDASQAVVVTMNLFEDEICKPIPSSDPNERFTVPVLFYNMTSLLDRLNSPSVQ